MVSGVLEVSSGDIILQERTLTENIARVSMVIITASEAVKNDAQLVQSYKQVSHVIQ